LPPQLQIEVHTHTSLLVRLNPWQDYLKLE
jgi:hypothetical protein